MKESRSLVECLDKNVKLGGSSYLYHGGKLSKNNKNKMAAAVLTQPLQQSSG